MGGIYEKCSIGVHVLRDWLDSMTGWIGGGDWAMLGDWNAYHHRWSLDGRSGPVGWVLAEWLQERGPEVHQEQRQNAPCAPCAPQRPRRSGHQLEVIMLTSRQFAFAACPECTHIFRAHQGVT